ncbi:MAG: flagellar FliJ family protein [Anaerolineales bacterium]|nr:flagellar FliJ family protein [Anaerolineales bacterium]
MTPKFSLQSILDYRHSKVEALEVELSQLNHGLQQAQSVLQGLIFRHSHLLESLGKQQLGDVDLNQLTQVRTNLQLVERQIVRQQAQVATLAEKVAAKRAEVVQAKQDEEALNTLKRKENERIQAQLRQQEDRQQDDAYIAQSWRATQFALYR